MVTTSKYALKCHVCGVKLQGELRWACAPCRDVLRNIDEAHTEYDYCMTRDPDHVNRVNQYAEIIAAGGRIFE